MTPGNTNTNKRDPTNNTSRAWKIAANPEQYSKTDRKLLIQRGISEYTATNGELNEGDLLGDVSQFIVDALDRKLRREVVNDPPGIIHYPGRMVLLMSLGSVLSRKHDLIKEDPRKPLLHTHVRGYYLNLLFAASKHTDHGYDIRVGMGERVYGREQEDEYGPPVGKPIEGIEPLDGFDGYFYQIPIVHANRKCEARTGNGKNGEMKSLIKGKYIYLPVDDVDEKYEEYFTGYDGIASTLEQVVTLSLSKEQLNSYQEELTKANNRIEELQRGGHEEILFKERRYPPELEVILMSVEGVDEDVAKLGEQLTAEQIYNAVRDYGTETDVEWVKGVADDMSSPSSIATRLSNYANGKSYDHVTAISRSGKPDLYELEYQVGDFKQIDVTEISDLLELPCMENLHNSLMDSKPVRWELYSFVRYLFEIDEVDFTVEDIKEWFSQYPWYDADITDYQVRYEREQQMADGDRPLPIGCSNDNKSWASHCIGKEHCDYSLYQSVDLRPDVYDRADSE